MTKLREEDEVAVKPAAVSTPVSEVEQPPSVGGVVEAPPIGAQYIIRTDNSMYTGKVFGISITEGRGVLNEDFLDKRVGMTVEQIVAALKTMPGYAVTKTG